MIGRRCTLTAENAMCAIQVTMLQILRKVHNGGREGDHGGKSKRLMHARIADGVGGIMGEIACSQIMNLAWVPGGKEISGGEVGGVIEVRHTEHMDGHLLIYHKDSDRSIFAMMVGSYPDFWLRGFKLGTDCKHADFWHATADPPCWWVPQIELGTLDAAVARLRELQPDLAAITLRIVSSSAAR